VDRLVADRLIHMFVDRGIVVGALVLAFGCGKKDAVPNATGSGSAMSTTTTAARPETASKAATPVTTAGPPRSAPGTPESLQEFDRACDAGHGPACFDAGVHRALGKGAPRDRLSAMPWLEKGARSTTRT
jgi:TPR repeat protein